METCLEIVPQVRIEPGSRGFRDSSFWNESSPSPRLGKLGEREFLEVFGAGARGSNPRGGATRGVVRRGRAPLLGERGLGGGGVGRRGARAHGPPTSVQGSKAILLRGAAAVFRRRRRTHVLAARGLELREICGWALGGGGGVQVGLEARDARSAASAAGVSGTSSSAPCSSRWPRPFARESKQLCGAALRGGRDKDTAMITAVRRQLVA
mmetsp:Transcript_13000/g.45705  ORF Transcript_13000/g.45705 Transcript_13000/m.45705 type:complete len:210 (-) Transcript_13000:123-752(-)